MVLTSVRVDAGMLAATAAAAAWQRHALKHRQSASLPHGLQDDAFGCPYKTLSAAELAAALARLRLPPRAVDEAASRARAGHFQLACASAFEGAHGCACDTGINHPNQARWPVSHGAVQARVLPAAGTQGLGGRGAYQMQPRRRDLQGPEQHMQMATWLPPSLALPDAAWPLPVCLLAGRAVL